MRSRNVLFILLQVACVQSAFAAGTLDQSAPVNLSMHCHEAQCPQMSVSAGSMDDIYHAHAAGDWMVSYKFMQMEMKGLRDGTRNVPVRDAIPMTGTPYGYMMAPTKMYMYMHMVMGMYGLNDRFTVMGMAAYLQNKMDMLMNMGMRDRAEPPMRTSGLGDTEVRGIYKINESLNGSLGLSLPTGKTDKEFTTMHKRFRDPYDMQLGSGTYDLKPALTYNGAIGRTHLNWGAQTQYTYRCGENSNHYSLGNNVKATSWLQRGFGPFTPSLRVAYNYTRRIRGSDPEIQKLLDRTTGAPTPDADPRNYGGQRVDGLLGANFTKGSVSFGIEGGYPLYEKLNGLQLKTKWVYSAGIQAMF